MTVRPLVARLAPLAFVAIAPLLAACAGSAPPPPPAAPESAAPALPPGARVRVDRGGAMLEGRIVRPEGRDVYRVEYDAYGPSFTELVPASRVTMAPPGPALAAGQRVLVRTQARPMLAEVVQPLANGRARVHYDGFAANAVEDVGPDRLILPFAGAAPHHEGEEIGVDVNGRVMPARILALVDATRYLARFDGFGAEYDQVVGPDRIRPAPAKQPASSAAPPAPPGPPPAPAEAKGKAGAKATPAKAAPAAAAAPAGPPKAGDVVLVHEHGALVEGTVTSVAANGTLHVKLSASGGGEEDVAADHVARFAALAKGAPLAPNQPVWVEWHDLFVPGKALKQSGKGMYRIRFEGFGPELDEVVPVRRLRARP